MASSAHPMTDDAPLPLPHKLRLLQGVCDIQMTSAKLCTCEATKIMMSCALLTQTNACSIISPSGETRFSQSQEVVHGQPVSAKIAIPALRQPGPPPSTTQEPNRRGLNGHRRRHYPGSCGPFPPRCLGVANARSDPKQGLNLCVPPPAVGLTNDHPALAEPTKTHPTPNLTPASNRHHRPQREQPT